MLLMFDILAIVLIINNRS